MNKPVVDDNVGAVQKGSPPHRDQIGVARTGTYNPDSAHRVGFDRASEMSMHLPLDFICEPGSYHLCEIITQSRFQPRPKS